MDAPTTLHEAILYFSDLDRCHEYMVARRWPTAGPLPAVRVEASVPAEREGLEVLRQAPAPEVLAEGRNDFRGLAAAAHKWLPAVWMITNCKNGISCYEIARASA